MDKSIGFPSIFLKAELEGKRIGYPFLRANISNTILNCSLFWCPRSFWSPGQHTAVRLVWMRGVPEGELWSGKREWRISSCVPRQIHVRKRYIWKWKLWKWIASKLSKPAQPWKSLCGPGLWLKTAKPWNKKPCKFPEYL